MSVGGVERPGDDRVVLHAREPRLGFCNALLRYRVRLHQREKPLEFAHGVVLQKKPTASLERPAAMQYQLDPSAPGAADPNRSALTREGRQCRGGLQERQLLKGQVGMTSARRSAC